MMKWNYKIALASQSPRRAYLLKEAEIPFRKVSIDVDEHWPASLEPDEIPTFLAEKKANHALPYINPDEVVLTADSIVISGEKILGKPKDKEEATSMLQSLSGSTHRVITGVCLMHPSFCETFDASSIVHMGELSRDEIAFYVDHFKPYDKAGSYAIQEWIGWCRVQSIEGSFANIMGLPVHSIYEKLKELDILSWD